MAFSAFKSRAKMGSFLYVKPINISPNRCFKLSKSVAMQRIAITSEAGVILKPSCLGTPFAVPPKPMVISLKALSFISITRFQRMVRGSIFKLATLF